MWLITLFRVCSRSAKIINCQSYSYSDLLKWLYWWARSGQKKVAYPVTTLSVSIISVPVCFLDVFHLGLSVNYWCGDNNYFIFGRDPGGLALLYFFKQKQLLNEWDLYLPQITYKICKSFQFCIIQLIT